MTKKQAMTAASAPAEFLPTCGGVYHVENGVVTVLEGGPVVDAPAQAAPDEQAKEGTA